MKVIVDTSVWVDHFKKRNDALIALLQLDRALTHPMVLAELACGTPPAPRARTLGDIGLFEAPNQASVPEILQFIEVEQLHGLGCGLVDVALLASTLITPGAQLWTLDKRLAALAERFGVRYLPQLH